MINRSTTRFIGILCCAACAKSSSSDNANGSGSSSSTETKPDALPGILNKDLPFRYPPALYAEKAQGDVTLRLYIDTTGSVVNDSTHVAESSKVAAFDSAAIKGARELRFTPAKLHGAPIAVSILFPVFFRHPEAAPPPGDTMFKKKPALKK